MLKMDTKLLSNTPFPLEWGPPFARLTRLQAAVLQEDAPRVLVLSSVSAGKSTALALLATRYQSLLLLPSVAASQKFAAAFETYLGDSMPRILTPADMSSTSDVAELQAVLVDDLEAWELRGLAALIAKAGPVSRVIFTAGQSVDLTSLRTAAGGSFRILRLTQKLPPPPSLSLVGRFFLQAPRPRLFALLYLLTRPEMSPTPAIVVCDDLVSAYRVHTFLGRTGAPPALVLNHKHPQTLRTYRVSLLSAGQAALLITTNELLESESPLSTARTLIFLCAAAPTHLPSTMPSCCLVLSEGGEGVEGFAPCPVPSTDVDLFLYRASNVLSALTPGHLRRVRQLETQRLLLRSRRLRTHLAANPSERTLLVARMQRLRREIARTAVTAPAELPPYLKPSFVAASTIRTRVEDPVLTDARQLRPLSANKKWKARHRRVSKPTRAARKRAQRGIFTA